VITNGHGQHGLFTVQMILAPQCSPAAANWLQIGVEIPTCQRFHHAGTAPAVEPSPYAIFAESAGIASGTVVRS